MVKYTCNVNSSLCLIFTAVHEDIPKCMPGLHSRLSLTSSIFSGFESRRTHKRIARGWVLSFGTQKNGTRNRVRERFYSDIRYHSAKREVLRYASQSNAKASLA